MEIIVRADEQEPDWRLEPRASRAFDGEAQNHLARVAKIRCLCAENSRTYVGSPGSGELRLAFAALSSAVLKTHFLLTETSQ